MSVLTIAVPKLGLDVMLTEINPLTLSLARTAMVTGESSAVIAVSSTAEASANTPIDIIETNRTMHRILPLVFIMRRR